eukprot:2547357-Amphidinium_carterae.1
MEINWSRVHSNLSCATHEMFFMCVGRHLQSNTPLRCCHTGSLPPDVRVLRGPASGSQREKASASGKILTLMCYTGQKLLYTRHNNSSIEVKTSCHQPIC